MINIGNTQKIKIKLIKISMHMEIKVKAMRVNIVPKFIIAVQEATELMQSWYSQKNQK